MQESGATGSYSAAVTFGRKANYLLPATETHNTTHSEESEETKNLPNMDKTPQAVQIIRLRPTEPVSSSTPFGDTNIPEPENDVILMSVEHHYFFSHTPGVGSSHHAKTIARG